MLDFEKYHCLVFPAQVSCLMKTTHGPCLFSLTPDLCKCVSAALSALLPPPSPFSHLCSSSLPPFLLLSLSRFLSLPPSLYVSPPVPSLCPLRFLVWPHAVCMPRHSSAGLGPVLTVSQLDSAGVVYFSGGWHPCPCACHLTVGCG